MMFDAFDDDLAFDDNEFVNGVAVLVGDGSRTSGDERPVASAPTATKILFSDSGISASLNGSNNNNNDSGFFEVTTSVASRIQQSFSRGSLDSSLRPVIAGEHVSGLTGPGANINDNISSERAVVRLRRNANDDISRERTEIRRRSASPVHGKRLFPGPAGKFHSMTSPDLNVAVQRPTKRACWTSLVDFAGFQPGIVATQVLNDEAFRDGPWAALRHDLAESKIMKENFGLQILDKCNIAYLLEKASKNKLQDRKAPSLLCVLLQAIDYVCSVKFCRVVLRDPTGEMTGWMDRDVTKGFGKLKPGCVLVLNKPSVVSLDEKVHMLSIHRRNITTIYLKSNDGGGVVRLIPAGDVQFENSIDGNNEFRLWQPPASSVLLNETLDFIRSGSYTSANNREPPLSSSSSSRTKFDDDGVPADVSGQPRRLFAREVSGCSQKVIPEVGESEHASCPGRETANESFRPEHDPLWNDDDFDDLMLKIDQ